MWDAVFTRTFPSFFFFTVGTMVVVTVVSLGGCGLQPGCLAVLQVPWICLGFAKGVPDGKM
jgi:hypothetical protein